MIKQSREELKHYMFMIQKLQKQETSEILPTDILEQQNKQRKRQHGTGNGNPETNGKCKNIYTQILNKLLQITNPDLGRGAFDYSLWAQKPARERRFPTRNPARAPARIPEFPTRDPTRTCYDHGGGGGDRFRVGPSTP